MTILLVSGSARAASTNAAVLRTVAALLPAGEAEHCIAVDQLPHFNPDLDIDPLPEPVAELRAAIARAEAVLFCTPEYAGHLPGSLKNLLDWTVGGTETTDKPCAWVNAGGPQKAQGAHAELRTVLGYTGTRVVDEACLQVAVAKDHVADGLVVDEAVRAAILGAVAALRRG